MDEGKKTRKVGNGHSREGDVSNVRLTKKGNGTKKLV